MGQIANRQSLVFSERGQLSQAIPQVHVERILHQQTPIARSESQSNERRVYEDQILCFWGRYDCQRTLVIRIAAITLASDSAITLARFRPSKELRFGGNTTTPGVKLVFRLLSVRRVLLQGSSCEISYRPEGLYGVIRHVCITVLEMEGSYRPRMSKALLGRAKGGGKTWPVGNYFLRPSESCF